MFNQFKLFFEEISNNGAGKYLSFISEYFLAGFLIIFSSFKERFFSMEVILIVLFCASISTIIYTVFDVTTKILWKISKAQKCIEALDYELQLLFYQEAVDEVNNINSVDTLNKIIVIKKNIQFVKDQPYYRTVSITFLNVFLFIVITINMYQNLIRFYVFNSSIPATLFLYILPLCYISITIVTFIDMKQKIKFAQKQL